VARNEEQYAEIVKLFAFVLHQVRLYSPNHPTAQTAMRNLTTKLADILNVEKNVTFGPMEGILIINDCPFDNKKIGVQVLLVEFKRLEIERVILEPGLEGDEIVSLLNLMALPPKTLVEKGGFKKIFEQQNFQHVRLGTGHYQLVGEEEQVTDLSKVEEEEEQEQEQEQETEEKVYEVTDEGVGEGVGQFYEQVVKIERMEELIRYLIQGTNETAAYDVERLSYELETKPQETAEEMVNKAESTDALKRVVQGVTSVIVDKLATPIVQKGRDFSLPVSRLTREYKKAIDNSQVFNEFSKEMVGILEGCADEVKLMFFIRSFVESGRDLKSLAKFLRTKSVRDRLEEPLRKKLLSLGVSEKDLGELFAVKEPVRITRASAQADVSPLELQKLHQELAELRRLRDNFNEELAARIKEEVAVAEKEKKRAVDEKERMNNIIRNVGEGLVVVDNHGNVQMLNPAAERLLGANQGDGKNIPISQLLKGEHLLSLTKGPLDDETDPVTKEIELRSVDDETRRVLQASTAVIENEDGTTVGMVSVLSDITKQKQLDEMKSKFVANVSHELRTPLLAIEESLGLLLGGVVGEVGTEQGKFLSIAQRNITRLSRLINDLLDVAKLEARKMEIRPVTFELNDLVHHVAETLRSLAESHGVTIKEQFPEGGIQVEADPDRITQVVTNLMGNAIKFTPEGGAVTLEVDPIRKDPEISAEPCITISVRDTGAGIIPEDQKRIFQKFEQGSAPTLKNVSSTGLGLTIAKEIVELHRGKIWVESNEGEGSRFAFAIPRRFRNASNTAQVAV
jgi:PAS domain S-box-containing protein